MSNSPPPRRRSSLFVFALLVSAVVLLLPWWRNHGLLRDFYDYGNVIAAAGRIESGDKPYVDFLTPIQTVQFYQAVLVERLFGERYLSLTYANALFILGSFLAFTVLLIPRLGRWTALLVAAGVVAGSSVQHTIIWYNTLGITWVALVVWTTARLPARRGMRGLIWTLVFVVLWLGGMTKVTYQAATLAFALLFTLRSACQREISWLTAARVGSAWLIAGVVLPVLTEMALTGASFVQWKHNVLELASSRTDLLNQIATLGFYLKTPHYYYWPMYLSFVGGWGIALLSVTALLVRLSFKREAAAELERSDRALFWITVFGAAMCGVVFLAAHYEIAYMSGAAWLAFAAGVVVAFVPRDRARAGRWARITLAVGATSLIGTAWASAWSGARSLWGHGPLMRGEFVAADDLPAQFAYLRGLKVTKKQHDAIAAFAAYQEMLVSSGVPAKAFYFVNATDWMVRAMPEARHRGLPLWLQYGTTFSAADVPFVAEKLNHGADIQLLVSHYSWDWWPLDFEKMVKTRYPRRQLIGGLFYVYRLPRDLAPPRGDSVGFVAKTNSNLCLKKMTFTGGPAELLFRREEAFLGSARSHQITFNFGLYGLTGEMVAELHAGNSSPRTEVGFRIRLLEGEGKGNLLWDRKIVLTPKESSAIQSFAVSPGGNRVALEVDVPPGVQVNAGWKKLRTDHAGTLGSETPGPINGDPRAWPTEHWRTVALFAADSPRTADVRAFGLGADAKQEPGHGLDSGAPGELWMRFDENAGRVTGEFSVHQEPAARTDSSAGVRVFVAYYKSGRLEVMLARELHPDTNAADRAPQSFEAWLPEGIGWIGLIVAPIEHMDDSSTQVHWTNLRVH